jgi:hypothetical protein
MPIPSSVITAEVDGLTLNSSATYLITAVKGAELGTFTTRKGSFGSEAKVILKSILDIEYKKKRYLYIIIVKHLEILKKSKMVSKYIFKWLSLFSAFIALLTTPILFMDEEPYVEQTCRHLQLFWVLSGGFVVIFWYMDEQENNKIVPKIKSMKVIPKITTT